MLDSNFVPAVFICVIWLIAQMDNFGAHINAKTDMGSILADRIEPDRPVFVRRLSIWTQDPVDRSRLCPSSSQQPPQKSRRSLANCFGLLLPLSRLPFIRRH